MNALGDKKSSIDTESELGHPSMEGEGSSSSLITSWRDPEAVATKQPTITYKKRRCAMKPSNPDKALQAVLSPIGNNQSCA